MTRKMWIGKDGNLDPVEERKFTEEDTIQSMFNDNPDVIPGEDFGLDHLMVVGREAAFEAGFAEMPVAIVIDVMRACGELLWAQDGRSC